MVFISCSKRGEKIPADIIPEDKMVQILVEVHLAESQSQMSVQYNDIRYLKQSYYQYIFKKHQTNYKQLEKSFNYYAAHPDIFSKIYDEVITGLSKKQAETGRK